MSSKDKDDSHPDEGIRSTAPASAVPPALLTRSEILRLRRQARSILEEDYDTALDEEAIYDELGIQVKFDQAGRVAIGR